MRKIVLAFLTLLTTIATEAKIVTYPVATDMFYSRHNDDYTVSVRQAGGEWIDLFEYKVIVDMDTNSESSMVQFDFDGTVEVRIRKNNGMIHAVDVRPLSKGLVPRVEGSTVWLTLDRPQKLSVEFNGDRLHNLHLFANPLETETYSANAPGVLFFDSGVHRPQDQPGDAFRVYSNTTVYLAPGAVLRGKIVVAGAENVRIIGRGFIDMAQRGIEITNSKNIIIEGITVINPAHYTVYGGAVDGLTVRNIKSFSARGWSDGIDLMSCRNVLIDDAFMRNSDDCIAIYGHRWEFYGDVDNVVVQNSTLWADIAHPIQMGGHGNTEGEGEMLENLIFRNIDILEHDEDDRYYQGAMSISCGDKNLVRNVTFEDIRVESIQDGQLFNLRVLYNEKYNLAPGRGIKNITFRNITYYGADENPSEIQGYSDEFCVDGVRFENVVIKGQRISKINDINLNIGKFTKNITLK